MRLIAGIAAGSILWGAGVLREGADDAVFRIIFGVVASTILACSVWILGFPFRRPPTVELWWQLRPLLLLVILTGGVILLFSDHLGLMHNETDPETGGTVRVANFLWLTFSAYFFVIFPIVNWPKKPPAL